MVVACDQSGVQDDTAVSSERLYAADARVLIVADVHLDPFNRHEIVDQLADAPIERWETIFAPHGASSARTSSYGHDTNAALWLSSVHAMKEAIPHPAYILLAGDLLGHDFKKRFMWTASNNDQAAYRRFLDKTTDFVTYELTKTYPHTQILPTIGNNDGYCGDYASTPHDAYLAHQAAMWAPLIDPQHRFPDVATTLARGGYYRAETANGLRFVSVNSVFLANLYENHCGDTSEHPGAEELSWLRTTLSEPKTAPTLLLTHVPVGIDGFKTFFRLGFPVPLLLPKYQVAFLDIVNSAKSHVTAIITGHLHDVGYRQTDEGAADNKPVLITPSISPIFGNTPAFSIAYISKDGAIDDFEVHRLQSLTNGSPTWHHVVNFNERYHLHGVNAASIDELHEEEGDSRSVRALLQRDSVGNAPVLAVTTLDWKSLWCTSGALTQQAFLKCEGVKPPAVNGSKAP